MPVNMVHGSGNLMRSGGVMQWVERKLGRRLVLIVCDLHTGELGLRHLIIDLDGPTLSNNKWKGPLGKMIDAATVLEIDLHQYHSGTTSDSST